MIKADKAKPANPRTAPATKQQTSAKIISPELNSVACRIESGKLSITWSGGPDSNTYHGFYTDHFVH